MSDRQSGSLVTGASLLTSQQEWLPPLHSQAELVMDLGCTQIISQVELVNTHNRDRSTRELRVSVSQSPGGPWYEVIHQSLEDSRGLSFPLPLLTFPIQPEPVRLVKFHMMLMLLVLLMLLMLMLLRLVKFHLESWYGEGGGLKYFNLKKGNQKERESAVYCWPLKAVPETGAVTMISVISSPEIQRPGGRPGSGVSRPGYYI